MLAIKLLGPVTAIDTDHHALVLGGPKPRATLAVLALAAPRACSTDHLVDALWGEAPPASARNAIQVNITSLRKSLGSHGIAIERAGDGYRLVGAFSVDAHRFDELVAEGRAALRVGDVPRSIEALRAGLALCGGLPFQGIDAATFVDPARQDLDTTRSAALTDLAHAQLRAGDPHGAASSAATLLHDHPYDEGAWSALATAHYWAGQQDRALAACREARTVLVDELGVDPTAALCDLEAQILTHTVPDPRESRTESEGATEPLPLPSLPHPHIRRLDLVAQARVRLDEGQRLVTLVGIGGLGKTTLAVAVAHDLAGSGQPVAFIGLATDHDAATALRRVCRDLGIDGDEDPVSALAGSGWSGVLVLDNCEQVSGLGRALDDLLRARTDLCVLATSRKPLGSLHEHAWMLEALTPSGAEELFLGHAERIRPGISRNSEVPVRRLCALLDGIPLALELAAGRVRTMTPQQLLERFEDHRLSALDGSASMAVPERQQSLHRVLHDAWGSLGEPARRLLELLGSFDGWASLDLVEGSARGLVDPFEEALDELVSCGLVTLDLDGRLSTKGPVREFAHGLGERPALESRLVGHAVEIAAATALLLFGPSSSAAVARLSLDDDALTGAIGLACRASDAPAAAALARSLNRYWLLTGQLTAGRDLVRRCAAVPGHDAGTAAGLAIIVGTYASYLNDPHHAGAPEDGAGGGRAGGAAHRPGGRQRLVLPGSVCRPPR